MLTFTGKAVRQATKKLYALLRLAGKEKKQQVKKFMCALPLGAPSL